MATPELNGLVDEGLARLAALALPGGGFGYHPGGQAFVEPTALALLALAPPESAAAHASLTAATLAKLSSWQKPQGFFGAFPEDPEPSWMTSPALLALIAHRASRIDDAGRWLAGWTAPEKPFDPSSVSEFARVLKIDATIGGWPWQAGEAFATVEPTALAAIALHSWNGEGSKRRIATSLDYFANRECRGGGWNYGNPYFLDSVQKPITLPTAKALLALVACGTPATSPIVSRAAERLESLLAENPSRKAHGWGSLAFAALGEKQRGARHAELAADPGDGRGRFGAGADTTALAVVALRIARGDRIPGFSRASS